MCDGPFESEEQLLGVAIILILANRVLDGLLSQTVLQLEGNYWQTIDEDACIK